MKITVWSFLIDNKKKSVDECFEVEVLSTASVDKLKDAIKAKKANELCEDEQWVGGLPNVAVGYGFRKGQEAGMPVVVGLSNPREVHESIRAWREIKDGKDSEQRAVLEAKVVSAFGTMVGWSWASPPPELQV